MAEGHGGFQSRGHLWHINDPTGQLHPHYQARLTISY
jgi:hypothetical protein